MCVCGGRGYVKAGEWDMGGVLCFMLEERSWRDDGCFTLNEVGEKCCCILWKRNDMGGNGYSLLL